jgi:nucleotide-binding universal stress UspA family protein
MVPLDGSSFGEQALPLASAIARRSGATLEMVHKHVPPAPVHPDSVLSADARLDPRSRKLEQGYLDAIVTRLSGTGLRKASTALLDGPIADALVKHAVDSGADLVVMTTHGRGPLQRFWLGSVADALLRRLPMPLLLLRPREEEEGIDKDESAALPRRILVPLDAGHSERILRFALELGRLSGAEYHLLNVVAPVPILGYDMAAYAPAGTDLVLTDKLQRDAIERLEKIATPLRREGLTVHVRAVAEVNTATTILEQCRSLNCDLIALETHGRGGLSRLLLGSVADKVVRGASVPVLVHRSPEP